MKSLLLMLVIVFVSLSPMAVFAGDEVIQYNGQEIRVNSANIKNLVMPMKKAAYVFENKFGIYAVVDFFGKIDSKKKIIVNDEIFKTITISQFTKDKIRIALHLQKKNDFTVTCDGETIIIIQKEKKEVSSEKNVVIPSIAKETKTSTENQISKKDDHVSLNAINQNPEENNEISNKSKKESENIFGINGSIAQELKEKNNFTIVNLYKSGVFEDYKQISYKASFDLEKDWDEDDLSVLIKQLYVDYEFEKLSLRFGWSSESATGFFPEIPKGFGAFSPKRFYDYIFPDPDRQAIAVPEILAEYYLNEKIVLSFLWQINSPEHKFEKHFQAPDTNFIVNENKEGNILENSNYQIGTTLSDEGSNYKFYYRYGHDLFPVYEPTLVGVYPQKTILLNRIRDPFSSYMAGYSKELESLGGLIVNAEFVFNHQKPLINENGKLEKANEYDMLIGVDYNFEHLETKIMFDCLYNTESGTEKTVSVWLKPNLPDFFGGFKLETLISYNIDNDELIFQPEIKKQLTDKLSFSIRGDYLKNPSNMIVTENAETGVFIGMKYTF